MEETPKLNRAQRRAEQRRAKAKPTNNRKSTKGRKTQIVPVMETIQTKFGPITVPTDKTRKIEHSNVLQKDVRTKWSQNKKQHEAEQKKAEEPTKTPE